MNKEPSLQEAVRSGDPRKALTAIRDYLAHELEGNRCKTCKISQLRTGDTAALVLRLQQVLKEIEALPAATEEENPLEQLRKRRASRASASPVLDLAKRRRTGTGEPGN